MSLRIFPNYHCLLALDPDEWPGEWERLLNDFPSLMESRRTCFEFERETTVIVLGPDARLIEEVAGFFELVNSRRVPAPNGGIIFLDESGQLFKTNWDLSETWDWQIILQRLESGQSFLHCFAASGAVVEFRRENENVYIQDLDYEHPCGLEGSRTDLQGVVLINARHFADEVRGVLDYLRALIAFAARNGQTASLANAFGLPQESSVDDASRLRPGIE